MNALLLDQLCNLAYGAAAAPPPTPEMGFADLEWLNLEQPVERLDKNNSYATTRKPQRRSSPNDALGG